MSGSRKFQFDFGLPVSWIALVILDAVLITWPVLSANQTAGLQKPATMASDDQQIHLYELKLPESEDDDAVVFDALDVVIDAGANSLAAWQLELKSTDERVEIVGIEGGEHTAFAEPAYYDPRAMNGNRVKLAAYSVQQDLPVGRTQVARIHIQCTGRQPIPFQFVLEAAANKDGEAINAGIELVRAMRVIEANSDQ